jgi:hypothetical protein
MTETEAKMALAPTGPVNGYLSGHYPTLARSDSHHVLPWPLGSVRLELRVDRRRPGPARPDPGHTTGHLSVVVDRGDDLVLVAGDGA